MDTAELVDGKWRLERELGVGGMGIVYVAVDIRLGRKVAIKFLKQELLSVDLIVERFKREARASARFEHKNTCKVLDVGESSAGVPYIVMELLEGVDLARALERGPFTTECAVRYVAQACQALEAAHREGMVHRDLKPANLFLTKHSDGTELVKVLDFGLVTALPDEINARLTATRDVMGSPLYMSPEQLTSPRLVNPRSDVWSLGVSLYQLVSGRLPFTGETYSALSVAIVKDQHPQIDGISDSLKEIIDKCLSKKPEDRFASATELASELAIFDEDNSTQRGYASASKPTSSSARVSLKTTDSKQISSEPSSKPSSKLLSQIQAQRLSDKRHQETSLSGASGEVPRTSARIRRSVFWTVGGVVVIATVVVLLVQWKRTDANVAEFSKIDISAVANHELDWFVKPPQGDIVLGGVPFYIREGARAIIETRAQGRNDLSARFGISVRSIKARKAHLLVSGDWVSAATRDVIGEIDVHHANDQLEKVLLVRGVNIREGWMTDRDLFAMPSLNPPAGQEWANVLSERQVRTEASKAFLDMLSIDVSTSPIDNMYPFTGRSPDLSPA